MTLNERRLMDGLRIWMFHSRNIEKRINRIHERVLRLVYGDSQDLSFSELLLKDTSVTKKISKSSLLKYIKLSKGFRQK